MRFAFGSSLLILVWMIPTLWMHIDWPKYGLSLYQLRSIAGVIFVHMLWMQGFLILAIVPAWAAGAIAEEDRQGRMLELLVSPLSSRAIVLGKLAARMVRVGIALATWLPFALPCALLEILDLGVLVRSYAILLVLAGFVASLALWISTLVTRPRDAVLLTYLLVGGWLFLPAWLQPTLQALPESFSWLATLNEIILLSNPAPTAWTLLWLALANWWNSPANAAWAWSSLNTSFSALLLILAGASTLLVFLSILSLRPIRLGRRGRGRIRRSDPIPTQSRRPIGDDPMRWKERYASRRITRPIAWVTTVLMGIVISATLLGPALWALREQWTIIWDGEPIGWRREYLNEVLRHLTALLYLVGLAAVMASAATKISGERERGTWISLGTTPLTGREIVRAKVLGTVWEMRGLGTVFLALWSLGLLAGAVHPFGVLAAAIGLVAFYSYAAAVGVFCSLVARNSERALLVTFGILFLGNTIGLLFVPLELIGSLGGSSAAIFIAGVSPFVEWFSLASPVDIQQAFSPRPWDKTFQLPFNLWNIRMQMDAGLVRTYLTSVALHALGAVLVTRLAALAYEAGRGSPLSFRTFFSNLRLARRHQRQQADTASTHPRSKTAVESL